MHGASSGEIFVPIHYECLVWHAFLWASVTSLPDSWGLVLCQVDALPCHGDAVLTSKYILWFYISRIGSHHTLIKKFYFICDQICPYLSLVGNQIVDCTRVHAWMPHVQSRTWPTFLLWRKLTGVTVCSTSHSWTVAVERLSWKAIASLFFSKIQSITAWMMEGRQSLAD